MVNQQLMPLNGARQVAPTTPEADLRDLLSVGAQLAKSGFFADAKVEAQAVAKVLAGAELGIPPVASMMGIYFFQGKLSLSANLIAGIIRRTGRYTYRVREWTDQRCVLAFYEGATEVGESSFSMEDAQRAKLATKDTWVQYPRNLLFARALTNGARIYCPDVFLGGVYTPEEMGAAIDGETGEPAPEYVHSPSSVDEAMEMVDQAQSDKEARWAFIRAGVAKGFYSQNERTGKRDPDMPAMHAALGLPREQGALRDWAARYGWDWARKLLEDGKTVQDFYRSGNGTNPLTYESEAEGEPDVIAPDVLPADGDDSLSQAGLDLGVPTQGSAARKGAH